MNKDIQSFLDVLLEEIKQAGINVSELKLDHVSYAAESTEDYDARHLEFSKVGTLMSEERIDNRRIGIFKLNAPVTYKSYVVTAIELVEPLNGQILKSGWQHAEFLVSTYDEILNKYPALNWNTKHKDRPTFSRIKLALPNHLEVKFLTTPVIASRAGHGLQ